MNYKSAASRAGRSGRISLAGVVIALLLAALFVVGRAAFPETVGDQIRDHLLATLEPHYNDYQVDIGRVRYEHGIGVVLENFTLRDRDSEDPSTHVQIGRIVADTQLNLDRIREQDFCPTSLTLSGVSLKTKIDSAGHISAIDLFPMPVFGPGANRVFIEDAEIELVDAQQIDSEVSLHHINAEIIRDPENPARRKIRATAKSNVMGQMKLAGDELDGHWNAALTLSESHVNRRVLRMLPTCVNCSISQHGDFAFVADLNASLSGNGGQIHSFSSTINVRDGQYESDALPYRIRELSGQVDVDAGGIRIQKASALIDDARCEFNAVTQGFMWPMPVELNVSVQDLLLIAGLERFPLPEKTRDLYRQTRPRGRISSTASFQFDGENWDWSAIAECHDVTVEHEAFPYPVQHVQGIIRAGRSQTVTENLVGELSGSRVRCDIRAKPAGSDPNEVTLDMQIRSEDSIPIDETLLSSLTRRDQPIGGLETFARSLNPTGFVDIVDGRLVKRADGSLSKYVDMSFHGGQVKYNAFPYPIRDVRGQLIVQDDMVEIAEITGRSQGSSVIRSRGVWSKHDQGSSMRIVFDADSLPLDEQLFAALGPDHQAVWNSLSPSGVLKHLNAVLSKETTDAKAELEITAEQFKSPDGRQPIVSITPPGFPYRMDITGGKAHLADDRVVINDLEGWHGDARLTAAGVCHRDQQGRWILNADILPPSRMLIERDLLVALPEEVQGTFKSLDLQGPPVGMRGKATFLFPNRVIPRLDMTWDLQMQLEGNRIGFSGPVRDIRGELRLAGRHVNRETSASGFVRFDSLHAYDFQVVGVNGPFVIQGNTLYLGQAIGEIGFAEDAKSIRGLMFEGACEGDGVVDLTTGKFDVNLRMGDIDFATLLRDIGQTAEDESGTGRLVMRLTGLLGNHQTLSGQGKAGLANAMLYELPVLVRLLNVLSVKVDQSHEVSDSEISFRIDGENIQLDDIRITGDILVLRGAGTANLRQEIDLRFETGVSPKNIWSRIVSPLRDQKYTLWTIDVTGTLSEPIFDKRALKQIEQALERLFPEFEDARSPRRAGGRSSRFDLLLR